MLLKLLKWSVIASVLLLSGCGFQLRNHLLITPALHTIHLKMALPYSGFCADLRQNFAALNICVVNNPCEAPITLHILSEKFREERVTISATSLLSQYLLSYSITYQLEKWDGRVLVAKRTISVVRNYTVNANQILGASNEIPLLRQDMRREIVYQLINQLNSACVLRAIANSSQC